MIEQFYAWENNDTKPTVNGNVDGSNFGVGSRRNEQDVSVGDNKPPSRRSSRSKGCSNRERAQTCRVSTKFAGGKTYEGKATIIEKTDHWFRVKLESGKEITISPKEITWLR
jgi:hypothetical protein